ncbi:DUF3093 domain-containing protein [Cellulomonas taurus]|uniref:DUF3093 domain-containing protein n=1 Tax=Cellulomonas taurus TaxID=2729175 RepID=UPI001FE4F667|nr:DUF3093 domain-containing protein [Cellulomonas taurus]
MTTFTERLWPGPVGWLVTVGIAAMFAVAFWPVSPLVGLIAFGVVLVAALAMLAASASRVAVVNGELHAGSAHIPLTLLRDAEALDADATRRALGPELDARAHLCQRGWVKTAIRVRVDDPADPTPYWVVSTRRPAALVTALDTTMPAAPEGNDRHRAS